MHGFIAPNGVLPYLEEIDSEPLDVIFPYVYELDALITIQSLSLEELANI